MIIIKTASQTLQPRFLAPLFIIFYSLFCTDTTAQAIEASSDQYAVKPDDGTYKIETVTSTESCRTLCESDTRCRGTTIFQADITIQSMECRLNNGFGINTPFPILPPEPLDLNTATAELNAYRAQYGLKPVTLNASLISASEVHAKDLAAHGIASHTGTDGSSHSDRIQRKGYDFSIAAENVATGQKSWEKVFKAWQESPGHNKNLLQPDVTDFGIALVFEPTTTYTTYWAMVVAAPYNAYVYD